MLTDIHIRHLATIDELHMELLSRTTVFTGESGAGKSILIEAIELALGDRAAATWVRPGQEKAEINLAFDIHALTSVKTWLNEHDLDMDQCLIRRVIHKDGRTRSYINGTPTTIQAVRELSECLLYIHGQYEHQALLKAEKQRDLLDQYAGHLPLLETIKNLALQRRTITHEIEVLKNRGKESGQRSEWLRFQLAELHALQLQPGEWQTLEEESRKLTYGKDLIQYIQQALRLLTEDENHNVLSSLHEVQKTLELANHVDSGLNNWVAILQQSSIQLGDLEKELRHYVEHVDLDPEQLEKIEQRISQLYHMARKHQINPGELISLQERLETELHSLETVDSQITHLSQQQHNIETAYKTAAIHLSKSREQAASQLAQEITKLIRTLALPHGTCHIILETETMPFSPYGLERVLFSMQTNPGQPSQPITKIASGGELSRISLAIHLATAEQHTIPTLVFDEVDVGVGGAIAEKVGKLLRKLGKDYQVLCITHHPHVASQGHQHILVEKSYEKNQTFTQIRMLAHKERTTEIARMLGGEKITQKTLEHARELVGQES
ncbi:MAG: DNA repair protein RecN [Gammaproteobacteria bacterium RIFCSPHIGHO2_12_FULL_41_20]|nr:MAG: DNA repair protein RecN [Gammaproteobacteria bacterium RIFCSPHIGHO2_12_FULL_41_20]